MIHATPARSTRAKTIIAVGKTALTVGKTAIALGLVALLTFAAVSPASADDTPVEVVSVETTLVDETEPVIDEPVIEPDAPVVVTEEPTAPAASEVEAPAEEPVIAAAADDAPIEVGPVAGGVPSIRDFEYAAPIGVADLMTGEGAVALPTGQLITAPYATKVWNEATGVYDTVIQDMLVTPGFGFPSDYWTSNDWWVEVENDTVVLDVFPSTTGLFVNVLASEGGTNLNARWRLVSATDPSVTSNWATIRAVVAPENSAAPWLLTAPRAQVDHDTEGNLLAPGYSLYETVAYYLDTNDRAPRVYYPATSTWPVLTKGQSYDASRGLGGGLVGVMQSAGWLLASPQSSVELDLAARFPELGITDVALLGADVNSGVLVAAPGAYDVSSWTPDGFTATPTSTGVRVDFGSAGWNNHVVLQVAVLTANGTLEGITVVVEFLAPRLETGDLSYEVPVNEPLFISEAEMMAQVSWSGEAPTAKSVRALELPESVTAVEGGYEFAGADEVGQVAFRFIGDELLVGPAAVPALPGTVTITVTKAAVVAEPPVVIVPPVVVDVPSVAVPAADIDPTKNAGADDYPLFIAGGVVALGLALMAGFGRRRRITE